MNIPKFLRIPILINICERLLLNRVWKRCWKCEWPKEDLTAQGVAFKFLKTLINILWNSRFIQYRYCLDLLKVCEIFSIQSGIVTLLLKRIWPVKCKHIKDKGILLNNISMNLYSNETQIYFFLTCVSYCNDVTEITWLCGMEFFINLILQMLGWSCYVLSLIQIEQMVRKLRRKYLCSYF